MKKYLIIGALAFVCVFTANAARAACTANQIDVTGNGTNCQDTKFSVTTTANQTTFEFKMTAKGNPFYVDCGNGGTLSQSGTTSGSTVSGKTITRTDASSETTYTCTWGSGAVQTVRFGGVATNYNTGTSTAAITFYTAAANAAKVASVSGNMSAMFPYISGNAEDGAQPRFYRTFRGATNLTNIDENLFADYTTGANNMFSNTFRGCTGLTSIPAGLFGGITTGANYMFQNTFNGCTGLTSIPADLFSGITTGAGGMFSATFAGCTGLTSIPADLFSGITTGAQSMFSYTFSGCTGLTSIPADLFGGITTGADYMFDTTFYGCTGLTSIPADLFSGITTGAQSMFTNTFSGCTGLTSIPADLFSGITTGAGGMFSYTFNGCTSITGYIPKSTFAGLIAAGSPTATDMWSNTFKNTQLSSTCPGDTNTVSTTYGTQWGNYAMCEAKLPTYIPTSQSYVTTEMAKLQNKFAGSGANKLMTYPTTAGGTPGARDIVTTLGTPNATTGVYSNTTDTTIPTTGAVKTGVDAKQNNVNGTADYVMTNTGVAGVVGEKAIYGSNTQFTDALVEVGTVNSAIINAVNSELTQVDETGTASSSGSLWRINSASDITKLTISE